MVHGEVVGDGEAGAGVDDVVGVELVDESGEGPGLPPAGRDGAAQPVAFIPVT